MTFEAAFGLERAVCGAPPRLPDVVTPTEVSAKYPRLAGADVCGEDAKAMLFALALKPSRTSGGGGLGELTHFNWRRIDRILVLFGRTEGSARKTDSLRASHRAGSVRRT